MHMDEKTIELLKKVKSLSKSVQEEVELEYHYVLNYRRAYTIIVTLLSLLGGVFFLTHPISSWSNVYGMSCFVLFCYILYGSPMEQKLTPESQQRVLDYVKMMVNEEDVDASIEETNDDDRE